MPLEPMLMYLPSVPCVRANHGIGAVRWVRRFAANPCSEQMLGLIIGLANGGVPNVGVSLDSLMFLF